RYYLDEFLAGKAREAGVALYLGEKVVETRSEGEIISARMASGNMIQAHVGIAAYGKRTRLDKELGRPFMEQRSPYLGVKYHIKTDFPADRIVLHNFPGGYCGLSRVEGDTYNMCYLASRDRFKPFKGIRPAEEAILFQNPFLKSVFANSDFVFDKPVVINEISFAPKATVEGDLFMCGDAAGLITPLCGNGMAMAIHGAWLLAETMQAHWPVGGKLNRQAAKAQYTRAWARHFKARLWAGRHIQRLFGSVNMSPMAVATVNYAKPVARFLMRQTHGEVF
ncbi:MAG: FAD-dependent oxidoreductase, partial [Bacteroidota bacterium]